MSFLSPGALWFLGLAALPGLLHLFSVLWWKRRDFPWVRLLSSARIQGKRWRRFQELLLLFLRTLAVASVVMAFARPRWGAGGAPVYVDASASMTPYASSVKIEGARGFAGGKILPATEPRGTRGRPGSALRDVTGYVISDFQASDWWGVNLRNITPVVVPEPKEGNVAIVSCVPEGSAVSGSFRVELRIRSYSDKPETRSFTLSGAGLSVFAATLELRPGQDTTLRPTLRLKPGTVGLVAVSEPSDLYPFDDTFYVAVASAPRLACDLLSDNPFLRASLFPRAYPSPIKEVPGAETVVLIGEPLASKRGVAFVPDTATARKIGVKFRPIENTSLFKARAIVKQGVQFQEGEPLLKDDGGRALAVRWGDWVLVGFAPGPEATDLVFKGDFPVLVSSWVLSLGQSPLVRSAVAGEKIDPGPGPGYVVGPGFRIPRRPFVPPEPGFYRLVNAGETEALYAVNVPRGESDPKRLSGDEIAEITGKGPVPLEDFLSKRAKSLNLSPWFLLLALAFLAGEGLMVWAARG